MRTVFDALDALRRAMFTHARPEAALGAAAALVVGVSGLALAVVLIVAYLRDNRFLLRAIANSAHRSPPRFGPLSGSLGVFLVQPASRTVLSPDAAAEFVRDRLQGQEQFFQTVLRFFAYSPLLFGLMGTISALRGLLVDSGQSLQEIQPDLAGVFGGTLAGIVGSLVATVGMVSVEAVSRRVNIRAQDFFHLCVLPEIPDRAISVHIEDAILERIGAKAEAVAQTLQAALGPLATSLSTNAAQATEAAIAATATFGAAASVVEEAGDFEKVARSFKSTASMLDNSAQALADSARQTAETLVRFGDLHATVGTTVVGLEQSSTVLSNATHDIRVAFESRMEAFSTRLSEVDASIQLMSTVLARISDGLSSQLQVDIASAEALRTQADRSEDTLRSVSGSAEAMAAAFTSMSSGFLTTHREVVNEIRQMTVAGGVGFDPRITEALSATVAHLDRCTRELSVVAQNARAPVDTGAAPELLPLLTDLAAHTGALSERVLSLTTTLREMDKTPHSKGASSRIDEDPPASRGLFRRFFWRNG